MSIKFIGPTPILGLRGGFETASTVFGKDNKDRTIPLPKKLTMKLKSQLEMLRELHDKDFTSGYAGVFLPDSLEKKYPSAAKDFIWQWFFPQKRLTLIPGAKEYRRYHLHESKAQGALKIAVRRAKLTKRVKSHTFRHSAVYPAQAGPRIFYRLITISGRSRQCWAMSM